MIIAVCVMAAAYFYGKLSPEQVWGILIGYNREELQYLSLQSLSQLVRIWDLETGMLIFCANMIRSGLFPSHPTDPTRKFHGPLAGPVLSS